jgi:hypothetical protein
VSFLPKELSLPHTSGCLIASKLISSSVAKNGTSASPHLMDVREKHHLGLLLNQAVLSVHVVLLSIVQGQLIDSIRPVATRGDGYALEWCPLFSEPARDPLGRSERSSRT